MNSEGQLENPLLSTLGQSTPPELHNERSQLLEAALQLYKSQYYGPEAQLRVMHFAGESAQEEKIVLLLRAAQLAEVEEFRWDVVHLLSEAGCDSWLVVAVEGKENNGSEREMNKNQTANSLENEPQAMATLSFTMHKQTKYPALLHDWTGSIEELGVLVEEVDSFFRQSFFEVYLPSLRGRVGHQLTKPGLCSESEQQAKVDVLASLMKAVQSKGNKKQCE